MNKMLITSYTRPDLDGIACMIAYKEFLNETGKKAECAIHGVPQKEVLYVLDRLKIETPVLIETVIDDYDEIVLVDVSNLQRVFEKVAIKKILEVIDHRITSHTDDYPDAEVKIEMVGSAATLISERFEKSKVEISEPAATLLYLAIISNTFNFKGKMTTERDREMASWLKSKINIPSDFIHQMFVYKSEFDKPLADVLREDLKTVYIKNKKVAMAQLEILQVKGFVEKNLYELAAALKNIQEQEKSDYCFLNCVDLEEDFCAIIASDKLSRKVLTKALELDFEGLVTKTEQIIQRKEIPPALEKVL
ncbi:DHH family phosphoesterase [Candidatus Kuenenbacteria bacterium]|nr:DHH family phosphoesterase [Candidatus Kuenenbacteria bacterium]